MVYYKSKKISLIILAITALMCGRSVFLFSNDQEGTNLLVTTVTAAIIYSMSLAFYFLKPLSVVGITRLILTVFVQILLVIFFSSFV